MNKTQSVTIVVQNLFRKDSNGPIPNFYYKKDYLIQLDDEQWQMVKNEKSAVLKNRVEEIIKSPKHSQILKKKFFLTI